MNCAISGARSGDGITSPKLNEIKKKYKKRYTQAVSTCSQAESKTKFTVISLK